MLEFFNSDTMLSITLIYLFGFFFYHALVVVLWYFKKKIVFKWCKTKGEKYGNENRV